MSNIETKPQKTEQILLADLSQLIEQSKKFVIVQANSVMTMLYWHVGKRINEDILQNKRADYGKQIVSPLATQLSWTHFMELLPLKTEEARLFYAREASERRWGKRELERD